jgi:hypothetical protein
MRFFSFVVSALFVVGCSGSAEKDFEKLAEQACACAPDDAACGNKVLADVTKFAETHKTSDGDMHRINEAGKRVYDCLASSGVKPASVTAALEKMVD